MVRTCLLGLAGLGMLLSTALTVSADKIPEASASALDKAAKLTLLSLDPNVQAKDGFHGYKILGQTTLEGADKAALIAEFKKAVAANDGSVAKCFIPRHGIQVVHDGKKVDFVICFQCLQVEIYVDGKEGDGCLVTDGAQAHFNAVLKKANVPLPPK